MYEAYWKLQRKPFEPTCGAEDYYPGETHQAALLKLRYAVENRRGGAVLVGPAGTGKTLLVERLRGHLESQPMLRLVQLAYPRLDEAELLAYLAAMLEGAIAAAPPAALSADTLRRGSMVPSAAGLDRSPANSLQRIERSLRGLADGGGHLVLAIDEAHLLPDSQSLETLRLLLNLPADCPAPVTMLLVGQMPLLAMVQRAVALEERMALSCVLQPLSSDETAAYVQHRLRAAGATRDLFGTDALEALHELSGGIVRRINRLADLALLVGFAEQRDAISADDLAGVQRELIGNPGE